MTPPRTSVTDEPIEAGRFARIPLGHSGLNIVYIASVSPRGRVGVRMLDEDGEHWRKNLSYLARASFVWFLLSPAEVRAARLPVVP